MDDSVRFVEDTHQYFNKLDQELQSVTRVIGKVKPVFERDKLSSIMGKKLADEKGVSPEEGKRIILQQWEDKRKSAEDRGNWIHNNLEKYLLTGNVDVELNGVVDQLKRILAGSYKYIPEALIYSMDHMVAGQSDLVIQRQNSRKSPVIDFFDYKTNEANGIQYDSIKIKENGDIMHYNRYMLSPFDYLEDCNFNHYSLQLSIYAYMSEITWGIKVGKLAILYIDLNLKMHVIPVPYMRLEAKALLEYNSSLKPLPQTKKVVNIPEKVEGMQYEEDDW
jgi:CRISPR/Cas system-associated exonuclease Cas4 (RecB family)